MGFSDKLREALGAEGVELQATVTDESVAAGGTLRATVEARGGTKPARLDAYIVKLIQSFRRWTDREGAPVSEEDALAQVNRSHLTARWDRQAVAEVRIELEKDLDSQEACETPIELVVPTDCSPSNLACTYTINVQADVKGQIDPTVNARVRIA